MNTILDALEPLRSWWFNLTFTSLQKRALLAIALVVVALSTFFIISGRTEEVAAIERPAEMTFAEISPDIIVDVAGGVLHPGVYTLPTNSRVVDAIKAAGGLAKGADASDVNQARLLKDGEQIFIYSKSGTPGGAVRRASGPISINRASAKEFESLQGIGPVLAKRIVSYRKENGPFTTVEDLLNVPGIGESTFTKFKSKIRV